MWLKQPKCMFYGHSTVFTFCSHWSITFTVVFLRFNDYLLDLNKFSVHVSSVTATSKLLNIKEKVDDINVRASNTEIEPSVSSLSGTYTLFYLLKFPPSKALFLFWTDYQRAETNCLTSPHACVHGNDHLSCEAVAPQCVSYILSV